MPDLQKEDQKKDKKEKKPFKWSVLFIVLKYTAFAIFSIVSFLLSLNMFRQLSSEPFEQLLLTCVTVALEGFKIFVLIRANTLFRLKFKKPARRSYLMYAILAMMSILAAYGTTRTIIERSAATESTNEYVLKIADKQAEITALEKATATLTNDIETLKARQAKLPDDFSGEFNTLQNGINKDASKIADNDNAKSIKNNELTALKLLSSKQSNITRSSVGMFPLMASDFHIPVNFLTLFILLLISILIELGIISTSPTIKVDKEHLSHFLDEFSHEAASQAEQEEETKKEESKVEETMVEPPQEEPPKVSKKRSPSKKSQSKKVTKSPVQKIKEEPIVPPQVPEETIPEPEEPTVEASPSEEAEPTPSPEVAETKEEIKQPDPSTEGPKPVVFRGVPKSVVPLTEQPSAFASDLVVTRKKPTTNAVSPTEVSKLYRFGKTTEAVKNAFVEFVKEIFKDGKADLSRTADIAQSLKLKPGIGAVFASRLRETRDPNGDPLVVQHSTQEGNFLVPKFPIDYIIEYSTQETGANT